MDAGDLRHCSFVERSATLGNSMPSCIGQATWRSTSSATGPIESKYSVRTLVSTPRLDKAAGRQVALCRSEINLSNLERIIDSYPSAPEQQRIVGILDEAFEGIATAKANAEKNLQNARALFRKPPPVCLHSAR